MAHEKNEGIDGETQSAIGVLLRTNIFSQYCHVKVHIRLEVVCSR